MTPRDRVRKISSLSNRSSLVLLGTAGTNATFSLSLSYNARRKFEKPC